MYILERNNGFYTLPTKEFETLEEALVIFNGLKRKGVLAKLFKTKGNKKELVEVSAEVYGSVFSI